jgi:hypothetical protein
VVSAVSDGRKMIAGGELYLNPSDLKKFSSFGLLSPAHLFKM